MAQIPDNGSNGGNGGPAYGADGGARSDTNAGASAGPQPLYWARTRRVTTILFLCWLSLTSGVVFFARELSGYALFGWPFSYYMAAQGTTLLYLLIVGLYAWRMKHLDTRFRREAEANGQQAVSTKGWHAG